MRTSIIPPHIVRVLRAFSFLLMLVSTLGGCGGDGPVSSSPIPEKPADYPVDSIELIAGLRASYDFDGTVKDLSGNDADARVVGHATGNTDLGDISFDAFDGIHALSEAAVFNEISGLVLPANVIYSHNFSVSLWVKPESGRAAVGPIFFLESRGNSLKLDDAGITVSGATGFGRNGDETLTYTSDDFLLTAGEWQHLAFTVDDGNVDIYINGDRVYETGDIFTNGLVFGTGDDSWALRDESFNDLFSDGSNTVAIGVTNAETDTPFKGKIDSLRIFDSALYYGNIITLSREVVDEGPMASLSADYVSPNSELAWTVARFTPETINIIRDRFVAPGVLEPEGSLPIVATLPGDGNVLDGSVTSFVDLDVPPGQSYRYTLRFTDAEGHIFESGMDDFLRVPGDEPYAAVTAMLNEETNNIELAFYTENIAVATYEILRDTDPDITDASSIAADIVDNTYIDERSSEAFPLKNGTTYFYWIRVTDSDGKVTTSPAMLTASATAAGDFIPLSVLVIEENTDGFCGVDGLIESNHDGFEGDGFSNTDNEMGKSIRWRVNVAEPGAYNVYVRYANGAAGNRPGVMHANGAPLIEQVNLPTTGAWASWASAKYVVALPEGEINLTLTAQTAVGLSNIDSLRLEAIEGSNAPTGVACAEQ